MVWYWRNTGLSETFLWLFDGVFVQLAIADIECQCRWMFSTTLIFKARIPTAELQKPLTFYSVTTGYFNPCSVTVGSSLGRIMTNFEHVFENNIPKEINIELTEDTLRH